MDEFCLKTLLNVAKYREIAYELEASTGRVLDELLVTDHLTKKGVDLANFRDVKNALTEEFLSQFPPFVLKVELEDSLIPSDVPMIIEKKKFRLSGEVWVIHKNDVDPFPSSPHAHNYDQNLVMHLGNGELYRKRELVSRVRKKNLIALRNLVDNVTLPPLEV